MNPRLSFGTVGLDVSPGTEHLSRPKDPTRPFCLAVLGDFSGRANRGAVGTLAERRLWNVDTDNFEEVFRRLNVSLQLAGTGELRFLTLDDFHPDQLVRRVETLAKLHRCYSLLKNPATAGSAAAELEKLVPKPTKPVSPEQSGATSESSDETFARLLGAKLPRAAEAAPATKPGTIGHLLQQAVGASALPDSSPEQSALLGWSTLELTNQLREILHNPQFQALEAAWRGLDLLVRNFGGEEEFKIKAVDVAFEELAADLVSEENLESTSIGKLLRAAQDEAAWGMWAGLYTFGDRPGDIQLLGRLAKLSALVGAPFISAGSPALVGCDSFPNHPDPRDWNATAVARSEAWKALRALPESAYLGLALPRFLLRQPYGKESDPLESFPFEELPADRPHERYLWGNPAVICAALLGEAFRADGWQMQPGGAGEYEGLPVHTFKANGETEVKPCAEAWLNERAEQAILEAGLTPLLSVRGRDAVRLSELRSVAESSGRLAGPWG